MRSAQRGFGLVALSAPSFRASVKWRVAVALSKGREYEGEFLALLFALTLDSAAAIAAGGGKALERGEDLLVRPENF